MSAGGVPTCALATMLVNADPTMAATKVLMAWLPSERDPDVEEQRVVVSRVASVTVDVGGESVELVVAGVLQQHAQVLYGKPVEFGDVAAAVRRIGIAFGRRSVESFIGAASRLEERQRRTVLPLVVIRALDLESVQSVRWVAWGRSRTKSGSRCLRDRKARVVRLLLPDIGCLRRERVEVGDVLVLSIHGDVAEAVGRRRGVEIVRIDIGRHAVSAHHDRVRAPIMRISQAPIRIEVGDG